MLTEADICGSACGLLFTKAEMGIIVNSLQQQRVRIVTNAEK